VFDFVLKLMSQAKRRAAGGAHGTAAASIPADSLIQCLNRVVLYQLSRPIDSHAGKCGAQKLRQIVFTVQLRLVDALHKLHTHRTVLLTQQSTSNVDTGEFYMCLAHLLFMLTVKPVLSPSSDEKPTTLDMRNKL
jgi:hypothetical protein